MLDLSIHYVGGVGDHLYRISYADTYAIQSQQGRLVVRNAWQLLALGA